MSRINLAQERIGKKAKNNYGSIMEIVEYDRNRDMLVKFEKGEPVHTSWKNFCSGKVKNVYDRTVHSIGFIGEGDYKVSNNGKVTSQYDIWYKMITRCYSDKYINRKPTYKDVTVCQEWHCFQTFASWYDENYYDLDGERMELDKDILIKGNKIYSPEACVFVPSKINNLFIKSDSARGDLPVGVSWHKQHEKYMAICNDNGKAFHLKYHDTIEEAFLAYKQYKEKLIKQIAGKYKAAIPIKLYNAMINHTVEITD